ncbi:MAG: helix-turn-helix transcriptional regulator [Clostridia bacterium]|nr:helix-turn-helix transcriptional regulator [Clostridia bacterium]
MQIKKLNGKSNAIGKNIKKYRELRGLTQRDLSNKIALLGIDIYHSDISQIENQKLMLKDFEIIAFCKVLGVTYEQLFEDTDNIFD